MKLEIQDRPCGVLPFRVAPQDRVAVGDPAIGLELSDSALISEGWTSKSIVIAVYTGFLMLFYLSPVKAKDRQ